MSPAVYADGDLLPLPVSVFSFEDTGMNMRKYDNKYTLPLLVFSTTSHHGPGHH